MNKTLGRWILGAALGLGGVAFAQSASDTGNTAGSPSVLSPSDNATTLDKKDVQDDSRRTDSQRRAGALDDRAGMENPSSTSGSDDSQIHRSSGTDMERKRIKKTQKTTTPQGNSLDFSDDKSDTTLKNDTKAPPPIDHNIVP